MRELIKQIVQFLTRRPIDVEIENNRVELMRERIARGHRV